MQKTFVNGASLLCEPTSPLFALAHSLTVRSNRTIADVLVNGRSDWAVFLGIAKVAIEIYRYHILLFYFIGGDSVQSAPVQRSNDLNVDFLCQMRRQARRLCSAHPRAFDCPPLPHHGSTLPEDARRQVALAQRPRFAAEFCCIWE